MPTVDPNEAPEGYVAVEYVEGMPCVGSCDLVNNSQLCCESPCGHFSREDGCEVVFKRKLQQRKPDQQQATANFPHGSLGEYHE